MSLKIESFEDVKKVPVVNKELMLKYERQMILTQKMSEELVYTSSSGSTGKPFEVYWKSKEHFTSYVRTLLALKGYNPFKPFVFIGLYKQKESIEKNSFLAFSQRYLRLFRREKYSVLTPFGEIVKSLRGRKIGILSSTSSCFYLLIDELKKLGIILDVKYVVVSGETLFDDLRNDLKTYLKAKVIDVYGCTELTSLAWTNPDEEIYEYALNAVMPEYINNIEIENKRYGELVLTNFVNKTMPFIRYNIGDHVMQLSDYKKMGRFIGRADDIMVLNNGRKAFMYQLYIFFNHINGFSQYKFLQRKDKTIVFQAICTQDVNEQELRKQLVETWEVHYGDHPFEVEFKDELPVYSKNGKFKRVEVE